MEARKKYIYKLRHISAKGKASDFSSEVSATTLSEAGYEAAVLTVSCLSGTKTEYFKSGDVIIITVISSVALETASLGLTVDGNAASLISPERSDTAVSVDNPNNTVTLDVGASAVNDYYKDMYLSMDSEVHKITAYNGTTKVATVDGLPAWTAGAYDIDDGDTLDNTYRKWTYTVAGTETEGLVNVIASGTTKEGSTAVTGTKAVTLDFTAPTVGIESVKLEADEENIDENIAITIRPDKIFLFIKDDVIDSNSGLDKIYIQNTFCGTSSAIDIGALTDSSLAALFDDDYWNGYYLRDAGGDEFEITDYDGTDGIFTLDGNPEDGSYMVTKYKPGDSANYSNWNSFDIGKRMVLNWDISVDMPYTQDEMPDVPGLIYGCFDNVDDEFDDCDFAFDEVFLNTAYKYGVIVRFSDKSGNFSDIVDDDIYLNRTATEPPIVECKITLSDDTEVFPNENGWYNDASLQAKITTVIPSNTGLDKIYYRTKLDSGAWGSWSESASSPTNITLSEGKNQVQFYAVDKAGNYSETQQISVQWDTTAPTWTPVADTPATGFNRIGVSWAADPADSNSGFKQVNIYRHTSNEFGSSTLIGHTAEKSYWDNSSEYVEDQTYYYWGVPEDIAGNTGTEEALGSGSCILIKEVDVDDDLRIKSPYNDLSADSHWQANYGIKVPIYSMTLTTGTLIEMNSITAIQYYNGSSWVNVTTPLYRGNAVSYPFALSNDNTTYTINFDPIQTAGQWKVTFDEIVHDEVIQVHFNSLLSADELHAGIIRCTDGIQIWSGSFDTGGAMSGGGILMDTVGIRLYNSAGAVAVTLDGSDSSISINNTTFGNAGIQLQYNSGTPRAYIGDGANAYLNFDGTKLTWKAANTELDASGNLIATSVTLSGAITATSGVIGGFTVNATDGLYAGADATRVQMKAGAGFWAGATLQASAPFRVTQAGALIATDATITGEVNASSGTFSGNITVTGTLTGGIIQSTGGAANVKFSSAGLQLYNDFSQLTYTLAPYTGGGSGEHGMVHTYAASADPGDNYPVKFNVGGNTAIGICNITGGNLGNVAFGYDVAIIGGLSVGGNASIGNAASDDHSLYGTVTLESSHADYPLNFGADVELYRNATNVLKTPDAFDANSLKIGGTEVITAARALTNVTMSGALITSGTVADARIASTIARDTELVTTTYSDSGAAAAGGKDSDVHYDPTLTPKMWIKVAGTWRGCE